MHEYDKATAFTLYYRAWDTANNAWVQEDAATKHTLRLLRDGAYAAAINTPQAVTHATLTGLDAHSLAITAAEADCDRLELEGESATEGVIIIPWVGQAAQHGLTAGQAAQLDAIEGGVSDNNSIMLDLVTFIFQVPSQVWSAANRTLTAFGFNVSLTAETEADIDSIVAKTDLLQPGEPVTFPNIAVGSPYVLYQGFDYLNVANSAVSTTEASAGEWDSTLLDLDSFRFVMRSRNTDDSVDVPADLQLDAGSGLHTLSADIENSDLPSHVGMYDGFFYATGTDAGTGSIDSDDRFPIVKLSISLQRGRYDCT